jgi:hypothetical protein
MHSFLLLCVATEKISLDPNDKVGENISMKPREALDLLTDRAEFGNNA